jgi:hypothetical protein
LPAFRGYDSQPGLFFWVDHSHCNSLGLAAGGGQEPSLRIFIVELDVPGIARSRPLTWHMYGLQVDSVAGSALLPRFHGPFRLV